MNNQAISTFMDQYKMLIGVLQQAQAKIWEVADGRRAQNDALSVDTGYAAIAVDIAIIAAEHLKHAIENHREPDASVRAVTSRTEIRNAMDLAGHLTGKIMAVDIRKQERDLLEEARVYLRLAERTVSDFPLTAIFGYSRFGGVS
jgi:hypothetical protein